MPYLCPEIRGLGVPGAGVRNILGMDIVKRTTSDEMCGV